MRISDWSSDVCSSDLDPGILGDMQLESLPGGEIVYQGLEDLRRGVESPQALFVCLAATRLRAVGFTVHRQLIRSDESRVGKEWVIKCRFGRSQDNEKKKYIPQFSKHDLTNKTV